MENRREGDSGKQLHKGKRFSEYKGISKAAVPNAWVLSNGKNLMCLGTKELGRSGGLKSAGDGQVKAAGEVFERKYDSLETGITTNRENGG